MKNYKIQ